MSELIKFKDGMKLKEIFFCYDGEELAYRVKDETSDNGIKSIIISMQNGRMAPMPWVQVEGTDGSITLVNLALCENVKLEDSE